MMQSMDLLNFREKEDKTMLHLRNPTEKEQYFKFDSPISF